MKNNLKFVLIFIITFVFTIESKVIAGCNDLLNNYVHLDKNPKAKKTHSYNQGVFSKGTPNYVSEVDGEKVFLLHKTIIMNQEQKLIKTMNWMKRLSDLKIAPNFLGLSVVNGTRHFVSSFIYPSILFKPLHEKAMDIIGKSIKKLSPKKKEDLVHKWLRRFEDIQTILEQEKIMTIDLQFLVTLKGEVYIIDPDLYQPANDISDFDIQSTEFELIYEYLNKSTQ